MRYRRYRFSYRESPVRQGFPPEFVSTRVLTHLQGGKRSEATWVSIMSHAHEDSSIHLCALSEPHCTRVRRPIDAWRPIKKKGPRFRAARPNEIARLRQAQTVGAASVRRGVEHPRL